MSILLLIIVIAAIIAFGAIGVLLSEILVHWLFFQPRGVRLAARLSRRDAVD